MCEAVTAAAAVGALGYSVYAGERQASAAKEQMGMQKKSLADQQQAMKEQAAAAPTQATNMSDDFVKQDKMKRFRAGMAETIKTNPMASATTNTAASSISGGSKTMLGA